MRAARSCVMQTAGRPESSRTTRSRSLIGSRLRTASMSSTTLRSGVSFETKITSRDMTNAPDHLYNLYLTYDLVSTGTQRFLQLSAHRPRISIIWATSLSPRPERFTSRCWSARSVGAIFIAYATAWARLRSSSRDVTSWMMFLTVRSE